MISGTANIVLQVSLASIIIRLLHLIKLIPIPYHQHHTLTRDFILPYHGQWKMQRRDQQLGPGYLSLLNSTMDLLVLMSILRRRQKIKAGNSAQSCRPTLIGSASSTQSN